LTIGISLCLRCADTCNSEIKNDILGCIAQINKKIKADITDDVKPILDSGIVYAKEPSGENKTAFVDSMAGVFLPHQAKYLTER